MRWENTCWYSHDGELDVTNLLRRIRSPAWPYWSAPRLGAADWPPPVFRPLWGFRWLTAGGLQPAAGHTYDRGYHGDVRRDRKHWIFTLRLLLGQSTVFGREGGAGENVVIGSDWEPGCHDPAHNKLSHLVYSKWDHNLKNEHCAVLKKI